MSDSVWHFSFTRFSRHCLENLFLKQNSPECACAVRRGPGEMSTQLYSRGSSPARGFVQEFRSVYNTQAPIQAAAILHKISHKPSNGNSIYFVVDAHASHSEDAVRTAFLHRSTHAHGHEQHREGACCTNGEGRCWPALHQFSGLQSSSHLPSIACWQISIFSFRQCRRMAACSSSFCAASRACSRMALRSGKAASPCWQSAK